MSDCDFYGVNLKLLWSMKEMTAEWPIRDDTASLTPVESNLEISLVIFVLNYLFFFYFEYIWNIRTLPYNKKKTALFVFSSELHISFCLFLFWFYLTFLLVSWIHFILKQNQSQRT